MYNNNERIDSLSIVTNKVCAKIKLEDVEFIEQSGRRMFIFTKNEEFICYDRIESLAPILVNKSFYRAKKCLVINFANVIRLEEQEILFESGKVYCIGRNNYIRARNAFKSYLLGYPPFVSNGVATVAAEKEKNYNETA